MGYENKKAVKLITAKGTMACQSDPRPAAPERSHAWHSADFKLSKYNTYGNR